MSELLIILGIFAIMGIAEGLSLAWEWLCRTINPSVYTTTLDRAIADIYREIENV